jgi:hypothetical protein
MAPSGRGLLKPWQLSGVKRTRPLSNGAAAFDPKRTLRVAKKTPPLCLIAQ